MQPPLVTTKPRSLGLSVRDRRISVPATVQNAREIMSALSERLLTRPASIMRVYHHSPVSNIQLAASALAKRAINV